MKKFIVEYDDRGNMRIVLLIGEGHSQQRSEGQFAHYMGIAQIFDKGKHYIAVGDYMSGGPLQPGVVYEVTAASCVHEWQEQPGEPPVDICISCGERRE